MFNTLPQELKGSLKKLAQSDWISPMLASLTEECFSRYGWIFEPKLDGERCLAFKDGRGVRLLSRNQLVLNGSYPELVKACEQQKTGSYIVDGEVVAFKGGVTSFEMLQGRRQSKNAGDSLIQDIPVFYYLFDVIYFDVYDLRNLPLRYRKEFLSRAIVFKDPLRFTPHIECEGINYYKQACRKGWES